MSIVWDIVGVLAVAGSLALALIVVMVLAAVDDELWWKRLERETRKDAELRRIGAAWPRGFGQR